MNKLKIFIITLIIIAISSISYIAYNFYYPKTQNITVFIHGTFMPELAILSPYQTYTQKLTNQDLYAKSLEKVRNNPEIYQDSLTLDIGLNKISKNIIKNYKKENLDEGQSKLGAYQLVGLYNNIYKNIFNSSNKKRYYTFGFSGLLSDTHRKESGEALYNSLIELIEKKKNKNIKLNINLVSFSHGGNVALYLALAESKYNKNLKINNLVLMGTPIHEETAHFATKDIFNRVINIYSECDSIQIKDTISTTGKEVHRKITDLIKDTKNNNIFNLRLLAHDDPNVFGHSNLWCLGKYGYSHYWWKSENTKAALEALDPLPIVTLVPCFIKIIEVLELTKNQVKDLDIKLKVKSKKFIVEALEYDTDKVIYESPNLNKVLVKAKNYISKTWQPYCNTSELAKTAKAFWLALKN